MTDRTIKNFIVTLILAFGASIATNARTFRAETDTIWGAYCYRELHGAYAGVSRQKQPLAWPSEAGTKLCYYLRMPSGRIQAHAVVQAQSDRKPTLRLRIIQAETGDTILDRLSTGTLSAKDQKVKVLPPTSLPKDTWYRFELSSPDKAGIHLIRHILFQRESTLAVLPSDIFMAPSTHLFTYGSTEPYAPKAKVEANDWCYMEVMYPKKYEYPNTYVMSLGVLNGYMGIQSTLANDRKTWRHGVIFSMWDNGDTDKDAHLPSYMRSGALDVGEGVENNRFGGEGTGTQALKRGDWWQPDHWVQFITHCRPEDITVNIKTKNGKDSVITYHNTLVSAWYKEAQSPQWHYLATLRESGRNHYFGGWYSFIENFTDAGGEFYRRAYFRNPYMRSLAGGKWYVRNAVGFGHTQNTGERNSRTDYGHGATQAYPNCFYLETGGYGNVNDSAQTFPIVRNTECIDTINLQALLDRENIAIRKDRVRAVALDLDNATATEGSAQGGAKAVAAKLIRTANSLGGYRRDHLAEVIRIYDNGRCTDAGSLRSAILKVAETCTPLKFCTVADIPHIGSFRAYQLQSTQDGAAVVGTRAGNAPALRLIKADGNATCDATEPVNNWMVLRSEKTGKYYLYNIGLKKFLDFTRPSLFNDHPAEIAVDRTAEGFTFKSGNDYLCTTPSAGTEVGKSAVFINRCCFRLTDNIAMQPSDDTVRHLLEQIDHD